MHDRHEAELDLAGVLCPSESLWDRLACRIAAETGVRALPAPRQPWSEPDWEEVAPGVSWKEFAVDVENERLSLLVRLAPAARFPQCMQQALEELYLLHGELWINGRRFSPGECNHTESGDAHPRVWSETGCTCVLIAAFGHVAIRRSDRRGHRAKPDTIRPRRRTIRRPPL